MKEDIMRPPGVPVGRMFRYEGRLYVRCGRVQIGDHPSGIIAVEVGGAGRLFDHHIAPIDGLEPPYQTNPLT